MTGGGTTAAVEVLLEDCPCYLIRNCLSLSEQTSIYQDISCRSKDTDNRSKPCMHPTPKTIIFDGNQSTLKFSDGDNNIYNTLIVQTANDVLKKEAPQNTHQFLTTTTTTTMSVGVIRYHVPNGKFPDHIDHCNDNSWVYLLSLGCSANFVVKGPHQSDEKQLFRFNSGDVLVFDPSSDAAITHGVTSINGDDDFPLDCPEDFQQFRFGVQCRVKMQGQRT